MIDKPSPQKIDYSEQVEVDYICYGCKESFRAIQGSKRYLCPDCLVKAVSRVPRKDGE